MRKLESIERNGNINRIWYIQKFDLETMKKIGLILPDTLNQNSNVGDDYAFIKGSDQISSEFIRSQNWMVDEWDYVGMSLYELSLAGKFIKEDYDKLVKQINQIHNKQVIKELKIQLEIKKNNYQSVLYLIKNRKEENIKRK